MNTGGVWENVEVLESASRYWDGFACSPENAAKARRAVTRFASMWLARTDLWDFELAVGEVLSNVVQHGRTYWIAVHCYLDDDRLVTEIQDYGEGFTLPQRFERPPQGALRGYGLFLMHTLLDELEFLDCGRHVRLVKKLSQSLPFQR
ncbi:MAG TPA: ATP-binding protein [Candidatus Cybelea sp.]